MRVIAPRFALVVGLRALTVCGGLLRKGWIRLFGGLPGLRADSFHSCAQFGIGVTVVEPGAINTGISTRRTTYGDEGAVYAADVHRMLTKLNANEKGGIPASEIAEVVMREVAAERPLALVARGSSASVAVPFMRRIPTQAMLTIMRRVHGLR